MENNNHTHRFPMTPIKLKNLLTGEQVVDTLYSKYKHNNKSHGCNELKCLGSIMNPQPVEFKVRSTDETYQHAKDFIDNYYASIKRLDSPAHKNRIEEIESQLKSTETYYLKETELIYGAKLAWRNASRCIGRIQWSKLQLFDARLTTNAAEMFEAICNHIKYATNKGSLRSAITIFPQRVKATKNDWRIWNSQLIGYAGYRNQETGKVVGDPANADFTEICQKLGWRGKGTRFDVLPMVLSANGGPPELFPLPDDLVMRVKIKHPRFKWFEELQLEWYALPAVANMMLDVGGLQFTAAPFSGWYMVTEIGSRDLGDTSRYNILEEVAQKMGLNTTSNMTLWKDQAMVELNIAVLDSFQSSGVTIVDHHTASETFMTHLANEQRLRGGCPADWVWLVPPTGGSLTQVFHQEMVNYHLLPNYEYMDPVWKNYDWSVWERQQQENIEQRKRNSSLVCGLASMKPQSATNGLPVSPKNVGPNGELSPRKRGFREIARAVKFTSKLFGKALSRRIKATILFATETGKSERFANKLAQTFSYAFNVHLMSMSDYDLTSLEHEALLLIVTSTFGNGDPPESGELFSKHLAAVKLTGDTSPDIESINSVSTNPFFQMISEDHKDSMDAGGSAGGVGGTNCDDDSDKLKVGGGANFSANNTQDKQEQQTHLRPLSNVRFSVFALGSTAYPHFCAFGRYVDQTLGELGAERILKCALGDELGGQEKAFNEWSNVVFKTACDVFCLTDTIGTIEDRPEVVWSPRDVKFVPVELIGESDRNNNLLVNSNTPNGKTNSLPDSPATVTAKRDKSTEVLTSKKTIVRNLMSIANKKMIPFKVIKRLELHKYVPEENLQTICIDLESDMISTNSTKNGPKQSLVTFEPGDHVAIYPINKLNAVQKILDRMHCCTPTINGDSKSSGINFDQVYTILVKRENMDLTPAAPVAAQGEEHWIAHDRLPVTSIREALTRYLDITSPPNQEFLLILSQQTSDSEEKKRLQQLAKNFSLYEEWKSKRIPSLLSLLEEFKTIKFEPALIAQIPLMKPRYYSISGTISLTVGVVRFKTQTGEPIEGLCSNYLNTIVIDSSALVYGYIRSAPAFHMPADKSIPVILISAGTGMAPFRSFWQQRYLEIYGIQYDQSKQAFGGKPQENGGNLPGTFGRIEMFFGCRNSNYILYKEELEKMYECGVLSTVEIAFSRPSDRDVIKDPENGDSPVAENGSKVGPGLGSERRTFKIASIKQARRRMYVQDKLLEHGEDLFKLIMHHGAHIYVCGDVAMADGVYKTLTHIISKANKLNDRNGTSPLGDLTEASIARSLVADDGETVLMNLRNLNRYHEDIFGAKQMS